MELPIRQFSFSAIISVVCSSKRRNYIVESLQFSLKIPFLKPLGNIPNCSAKYRNFHQGCSNTSHINRSFNTSQQIKECCGILGVSESCSQQELKDAFLKLARKYHPDSVSKQADPLKFAQVESAYRKVRELLSFPGHEDVNEMLEKDFGIKHTVPQHRQYLSYDGIGHGTPSQRQHQYQQHKVNKAVEGVYDYRIKKTTSEHKNALLLKDASLARQYKTRQAIERLVEDLILESMSRGEFDNLPGSGKPLKYMPENPYVDHITHKLNQILISNGFTPEWIALEKEIKEQKLALKTTLVQNRALLGLLPLSVDERHKWHSCVEKLKEKCKELNFKIDKFNMIVPTLQKQLCHLGELKEKPRYLSSTSGMTSSAAEFISLKSSNFSSSASPALSPAPAKPFELPFAGTNR